MPRPLSTNATKAIFSSETSELFALLVTIGDGVLDTTIRVCSGGANLVSNGQTFLYAPFRVSLPGDSDQTQQVTLEVDNVDRGVIAAVYSVTEPLPVQLSVVMISTPDTVEAGPYNLTLREFKVDSGTVSGTLMYEDVLNEPYPGDILDPANFPGIFTT